MKIDLSDLPEEYHPQKLTLLRPANPERYVLKT